MSEKSSDIGTFRIRFLCPKFSDIASGDFTGSAIMLLRMIYRAIE